MSNKKCDCLIIGYNDIDFEEFVNMSKAMGTDHADYRDLNLNYIRYNDKPYHPLEIFSHFYYQGKEGTGKPFHNADVMWMVVTYLGTYLSRRGFSFDYINLFQPGKEQLREKLEETDFLTVVITTTNYTFDLPIMEVMGFVKQYNRTAKIVVGGPYISKRVEVMERTQLNSLFKYIGADVYVCCREGEQTLVNIIETLESGGDFQRVPNIAYRNGNDYLMTPAAGESNSLEENMIDYSLFPPGDFGGFLNVRTSKGCPFKCSFCGFPDRAEKYKYLDVDYVKKELDAIRAAGTVTSLVLVDDTINVPLKRFKEMMRMMIREKYDFDWNCLFRCDYWDEETIELMKEAGCEGVFLGLESANDTLLKNMNKKARKEDYLEAIPLFKKAGIMVFASLFVGFPGETRETFRETMDFLAETEPDFYRPQLWYCEPLSPIYRQREKFGLKGIHFGWSHDTMNAAEACDLMEEAFMSIDTPVWTPDPGFNFSSLYYLKQRGMSFEQQKKFLKCYNAVVKERLVYPDKKEISPALLESLKKSCQFDRPVEPDMEPVELWSGSSYALARDFWIKEYKNTPPARRANKSFSGGPYRRGRLFKKAPLAAGGILKSVFDTDLPTAILTAYSVLLLRLRGSEDTVILTALAGKELFPLRLYPRWASSFGEFLHSVERKLEEAVKHCRYAFYFQDQPLALDTAFQVTDRDKDGRDIDYPGIELILNVINTEEGVDIQFLYSPDRYGKTIGKISTYLMSILKAAAEDPAVLLKNIVLEPAKEKQRSTVEPHASKSFNF